MNAIAAIPMTDAVTIIAMRAGLERPPEELLSAPALAADADPEAEEAVRETERMDVEEDLVTDDGVGLRVETATTEEEVGTEMVDTPPVGEGWLIGATDDDVGADEEVGAAEDDSSAGNVAEEEGSAEDVAVGEGTVALSDARLLAVGETVLDIPVDEPADEVAETLEVPVGEALSDIVL